MRGHATTLSLNISDLCKCDILSEVTETAKNVEKNPKKLFVILVPSLDTRGVLQTLHLPVDTYFVRL